MIKSNVKVAAAVAFAMSAVIADAGVVTPNGGGASTYSVQFSAREGAVDPASRSVAIADFAFTTGTALQSGDVITINLTGAEFGQTTASTAGADGYGTLNGSISIGGAGAAAANITATTGGATSRTYTLQGSALANVAFTLSGVTLKNSSMGSTGNVQVSVSVSRGAVTVDTAASVTVATKVNEFVVSVPTSRAWNGVIDMVGAAGKVFTSANDARVNNTLAASTVQDSLTLSILDNDVTGAGDATLQAGDALRVTLGGDFSFLNNTVGTVADGVNFPTTPNGDRLSVVRSDTGDAIGTILSASATQIVVGFTAAEINTINGIVANGDNAADTVLVQFITDGGATANVKKAQTFTASAEWYYTTASSAVTQTYPNPALTPGAHTMNGVSVFVPYMPVGPTISQILYLVNNSTSEGTAHISARNDLGAPCTQAQFGATTIGANSVTSLGTAMARGIAACYGTGSHKLYLTVEARIPDTGVELYSAYNVNGNRVNVVNSSNGRRDSAISCTTASVRNGTDNGAVDVCAVISNSADTTVGGGNSTR